MDAMKEAIKRKMDGGSKPSVEIEIGAGGDEGHEDQAADVQMLAKVLGKSPEEIQAMLDEKGGKSMEDSDGTKDVGMAPSIGAERGDAVHGEESPDKMEIMKALADRGSMGRSPGSLGEKAAAGAKSKMAEMMKKK